MSTNIEAFTGEDQKKLDEARNAIATFRKTFDYWVKVAMGLEILKQKATKVSGLTFKTAYDFLRKREGLGDDVIDGPRHDKLEMIFNNRTAIEQWRAKLEEKDRQSWNSPEAILKHCPLFKARVLKRRVENALADEKALDEANVSEVDRAVVEKALADLDDALKDGDIETIEEYAKDLAEEAKKLPKGKKTKQSESQAVDAEEGNEFFSALSLADISDESTAQEQEEGFQILKDINKRYLENIWPGNDRIDGAIIRIEACYRDVLGLLIIAKQQAAKAAKEEEATPAAPVASEEKPTRKPQMLNKLLNRDRAA